MTERWADVPVINREDCLSGDQDRRTAVWGFRPCLQPYSGIKAESGRQGSGLWGHDGQRGIGKDRTSACRP